MRNEKKSRLDVLLVKKGLAESREKAQALIMAGSVTVVGSSAVKPGLLVDPEAVIAVKQGLKYVGRGGIKLEGALDGLGISVDGLIAMDVGSSTGGFVDCLLKRGAKKVFAVDVGHGLLDARLRSDPRVVLLERRNIRHLDEAEVGDSIDIATIDVSFISLEKVLPKVKGFLKQGGKILALIKPQFEVGKGRVGKGGVVRDAALHGSVVERIKGFAEGIGLAGVSIAPSPITGAKGNKEFWIYLTDKAV